MLTGQGFGQKALMGLLVPSDGLHVDVEGFRHAGVQEVLHGVVLQALLIEGGFKVLQSQSIVQDITCIGKRE